MAGFDVGVAIAIGGVIASLLGWYRSATRQQYAREREYAHILNNLDQHRQAVAQLSHELDDQGDRLTRIEALILSLCKGAGQHG